LRGLASGCSGFELYAGGLAPPPPGELTLHAADPVVIEVRQRDDDADQGEQQSEFGFHWVTSSDTAFFAAPVASKHRGELFPSKKQTNGKSWANAARIYGRAFHIFVISNAGFLNR
jgi:hypothetical protein